MIVIFERSDIYVVFELLQWVFSQKRSLELLKKSLWLL